MQGHRMDAARHGMAAAHSDHTTPKREALRMGNSVRTQRRWSTEGPPQLRQIALYLEGHPNPHRILAHVRTMADAQIRALSNADLIADYRLLLVEECDVEAADRRGFLVGSWLDVAAESERDAAVDIRKAAIEREFAVRRITRAEVLNG